MRLGLVINPRAGIGGPAGLKGSDGAAIQDVAASAGYAPPAPARALAFVAALLDGADLAPGALTIVVPLGPTGTDALGAEVDRPYAVQALPAPAEPTSAETTRSLAAALVERGVDLIVFVGGDGTARDVLDGCAGVRVPVVGVPAGVKMHSGVFATSPRRAAELVQRLLTGGLVGAIAAEVRDIDEAALRAGRVGAVTYGELLVPQLGGYLQHTKSGGREVEDLVLLEIAADLEASLAEHPGPVAIGPGSTCFAVKERLGGSTLLGFDVVHRGELLVGDASRAQLDALRGDVRLVLSFSRGQGFLLGRGNQQLSPTLLRRVGMRGTIIVSSRSKLATLEGRPLLVDSGEPGLDAELAGIAEIVSGFEDRLLHRVAAA
ncbi:MAG: NAD(+)/NADH kinase [Pseudomonadota bacterium]